MRTCAVLFFTFAWTLLDGARGGCTGKVLPYAHRGSSHSGCYEVYVSCWTKFGDSCYYDFTLPASSWAGGVERISDLAGEKGAYHKRYPSAADVLALEGRGGRLHCGSDDGSIQWKNYEDVVICRKPTASPTPEPTPAPTLGPTDAPTPGPTASVPLSSAAVRQALDGLCSQLDLGQECLEEARRVMASLVAEATADGGEEEEEMRHEGREGAARGGVDVVAEAASGLAGGAGIPAAPPLLLAAAVAAAVAAFAASRRGPGGVDGDDGDGDGGRRRAYAPVPDAAGP